MACKYIFNGIEYKDKQTFIKEFVKPNFINQPKTLRLQELQQPDFLRFIRKDKDYLKSQGLTDQEVDFLNLLFAGDEKWATFFIKSVIQDAAKKGYEKVLFPTGNTASKIEGHETIEEFKKQKEDRIKTIQKEIDDDVESQKKANKASIENQERMVRESDKEWQKEIHRNKVKELQKEEFLPLQSKVKEINQLKQELERVETEGFGALKPIYNFYEETITNILINDVYGKESKFVNYEFIFNNDKYERLNDKNQYLKNGEEITQKEFNSIQNSITKQDKKDGRFSDKYYVNSNSFVTDEYGNTWNEVTITPEIKEKVEVILANNKNQTDQIEITVGKKELQHSLDRLIEELKIDKKAVKYLTDRQGKIDPTLTAEAKIVKTAKGIQSIISYIESGMTTNILAEEVAHIFTGLLGFENPLYKALETHIVKYPEYQEVLNNYTGLNEKEAKFEAIGKLIANNMGELASKRAQKSILTNLWDAIINWYKRVILKAPNQVFLKVAKDLLDNNISQYDLQLYKQKEEAEIAANAKKPRDFNRLDWQDDSNESKRYWENQRRKKEKQQLKREAALSLVSGNNPNLVIDLDKNVSKNTIEFNKVSNEALNFQDLKDNLDLEAYQWRQVIDEIEDYSHLSDEEKKFLVEEIIKGNLTISCKK